MSAYLKLLLFSFLFITVPASAQEMGAAIDASGTAGQQLIASVMGLLILFSSVMGVYLIFEGILKLFNYHKNPNDPKTSFKAIATTLVAGALLTNVFGTASIVISSVTGSDGFCYNASENMTGEIQLSNIHGNACFDADGSELTEGLRESLLAEGTAAWDQFSARLKILYAVIQTIGLYYFIKSIFLLKGNAESQNNMGVGKILVMMFFSSIAMDIEGGVELIINTVTSIGFNN